MIIILVCIKGNMKLKRNFLFVRITDRHTYTFRYSPEKNICLAAGFINRGHTYS